METRGKLGLLRFETADDVPANQSSINQSPMSQSSATMHGPLSVLDGDWTNKSMLTHGCGWENRRESGGHTKVMADS
jgi:hypothetical protein